MGRWQGIGIGVMLVALTLAGLAAARDERADMRSQASSAIDDLQATLARPAPLTSSGQGLTAAAAADMAVEPFSRAEAGAAPGGAASAEVAPTFELKTLATEADALQLCETFLQAIVAGEHGRAFDAVRPYFPVSDERFLKLKSAISDQLDVAGQHLGQPIGYTFLDTNLIGQVLLRYRFAQQFPVDIFYWQIVFYRTPRGWIINQLGFDDEVERLFRER